MLENRAWPEKMVAEVTWKIHLKIVTFRSKESTQIYSIHIYYSKPQKFDLVEDEFDYTTLTYFHFGTYWEYKETLGYFDEAIDGKSWRIIYWKFSAKTGFYRKYWNKARINVSHSRPTDFWAPLQCSHLLVFENWP
jgi:hypothetical protein